MTNMTIQNNNDNNEEYKGIGYNISRFFGGLKSKMKPNADKEHQYEEKMKVLKNAHKEWRQAELYFQNVTDPELIDHAIYNMEAAKKKYFYLLNQIRSNDSKNKA